MGTADRHTIMMCIAALGAGAMATDAAQAQFGYHSRKPENEVAVSPWSPSTTIDSLARSYGFRSLPAEPGAMLRYEPESNTLFFPVYAIADEPYIRKSGGKENADRQIRSIFDGTNALFSAYYKNGPMKEFRIQLTNSGIADTINSNPADTLLNTDQMFALLHKIYLDSNYILYFTGLEPVYYEKMLTFLQTALFPSDRWSAHFLYGRADGIGTGRLAVIGHVPSDALADDLPLLPGQLIEYPKSSMLVAHEFAHLQGAYHDSTGIARKVQPGGATTADENGANLMSQYGFGRWELTDASAQQIADGMHARHPTIKFYLRPIGTALPEIDNTRPTKTPINLQVNNSSEINSQADKFIKEQQHLPKYDIRERRRFFQNRKIPGTH